MYASGITGAQRASCGFCGYVTTTCCVTVMLPSLRWRDEATAADFICLKKWRDIAARKRGSVTKSCDGIFQAKAEEKNKIRNLQIKSLHTKKMFKILCCC